MIPSPVEAEPPDRLLRLAEVCHRVGLGKTMIYEMIGERRFPEPCKISPAASRWSEREIVDWIDRRKAARDGGPNRI
jgi:prophage regulatory protein